MATLGVAVFSFDGIKDLAPCLESVAWADRIVLLHLGADAPNVGAREMPALAVRRLDSWREADKYCAETGTDWLLYLWGDERLDAALARAPRGFRGRGAPAARGYAPGGRLFILHQWGA